MTDAASLVNKLWSFCHLLREDGLSYLDYLEQLTYLLFLKMADERATLTGEKTSIPKGCRWSDLANPEMEGDRLAKQYAGVLERLGAEDGMLGLIFRKAQNKVQDPAKLRRLVVELIGGETWTELSSDVKGDAYEGLLARNAEEVKSGAGQYFTPRALIQAMVDCVRPQIEETVVDPACGTGGFLLAAVEFVKAERGSKLDRDQKKALRNDFVHGTDLVDTVARLCAMNLFLHGVGPLGEKGQPPVEGGVDALATEPGTHYDVVLTNPPFGRKASVTVVNEEGDEDRQTLTYNRPDFWTTTANKQLNFVQHVRSLLRIPGRAAMVVPDNVLFEGGAGERVRRRLLHECDVHTLLRLPTGIFYAQGVKANVLFFDRKPASRTPWTSKMWVYDLRTNMHFTLKQNPLARADLDDFVKCYKPENRAARKSTWSEKSPGGRWRAYTLDEILTRDKVSLDLFWLRDESISDGADLPEPRVLAAEIADDLRSALDQIEGVLKSLPAALAAKDAARRDSDPSGGSGAMPPGVDVPRHNSRTPKPSAERGR